jgi:hydrogenase nickel incorporation protein HypA/HybF
MHELSIAQNILDIVDETMNGESGRLLEVAVEIGELVAVVPESLEFCYDVLTENSKYAGSKLIIKILPVLANCRNCDTEFQVEKFNFTCPTCKSTELHMLQGKELKISHLEVE